MQPTAGFVSLLTISNNCCITSSLFKILTSTTPRIINSLIMIERLQPSKIIILPHIFKILNYLYSNNHANKEHITVFLLFTHNSSKI